jgi:hypothetical protein
MRRVLVVGFVSLLLALFALSCTGAPDPAPASTPEEVQDDVNTAFGRVYDAYREALILDDAQSYTVVSGDYLAAITRKFYSSGNGYFFPLIMLASSEMVLDPELIEPGMVLTIPNLQRNLDDPTARAYLKEFLRDIADVYEQKTAAITDEEKETTRGQTRYTADLRTRQRLIELSESL